MFDIDGNSAIVTGGASGIGLAVAERLAKAGARVVILDVNDASRVAQALDAFAVQADVSDERQLSDAFTRAESLVGKLDIVVNNAGIGIVGNPITDGDADVFRKLFDVNVMGVYFGLKHAPAHMRDGGSIINTASLAGLYHVPGYSEYSASKASVVSLTKSAAIELGPRGIRVNAVCPGTIRTRIQSDSDPEYALCELMTTLGRIGETGDLAGVFHFLAAPESRYLTGQAIVVDGGWSVGISCGTRQKLLDVHRA